MLVVNMNQKGAVATTLGLTLGLIVAIIAVCFGLFGRVVPPDYIGIRHNGFGVFGLLEPGYMKGGLQAGLHWRIPWGVSDIHLIPRGFQYITFGQASDSNNPVLEIPTSDGSKVRTDVTMVYRYLPEAGSGLIRGSKYEGSRNGESVPLVSATTVEHGGPEDLMLSFTDSESKQRDRLSREVENYLRKSFGTLSTIDYYNPIRREIAALDAQKEGNSVTNPFGIEMWSLLVQRYSYAEKIDQQISAKNMQEQEERLNAAASKFAEVEAKREKEIAKLDAEIKSLRVEGQAEVEIIRSEGDLVEAELVAQGNFLVAESKAKVESDKNRAFKELSGSKLYVARELAKILGTLQGGVVSELDPYDMDAWVKRLSGGAQ